MNKKIITLSLFIWILTILNVSGCSLFPRKTTSEKLFMEMFPDVQFSNMLETTVVSMGDNEFVIRFENISNTSLRLNVDNNHLLYRFIPDQQEWIIVPELFHPIYLPENPDQHYITLDTKENYVNRNYFLIQTKPDVTALSKPITIRVLVIGEVLENNNLTDKRVGAFVDLEINE